MSALSQKRCRACEGLEDKLAPNQITLLSAEFPQWKIFKDDPSVATDRLHRRFEFKDFGEAMQFVNQVATLAENEQHHPNFEVQFNRVDLTLWTHAVKGLSENDFILAAKIQELPSVR